MFATKLYGWFSLFATKLYGWFSTVGCIYIFNFTAHTLIHIPAGFSWVSRGGTLYFIGISSVNHWSPPVVFFHVVCLGGIPAGCHDGVQL